MAKRFNSRAKGHGFERDVCKILNKEYKLTNTKYKFQRVPMSGGFDKENFPGDIFSTHKELLLATQFSIECKFHKEWKLEDLINGNKSNILKWWDQCITDAEIAKKAPLLVFKKNLSKIYYMTRAADTSFMHRGPILMTGVENSRYGLLTIGIFEKLLEGMQQYENETNKQST